MDRLLDFAKREARLIVLFLVEEMVAVRAEQDDVNDLHRGSCA